VDFAAVLIGAIADLISSNARHVNARKVAANLRTLNDHSDKEFDTFVANDTVS
jgi:hypothetical protein